jgi:Ca-activated chloride channel family protein
MGTILQPQTTKGTDIMLCLDTSTSMKSEDFAPRNRMDAAKSAALDFVKNRTYDRIGIVVFAGVSYTQCPLTLDHGAVLEFLDHVQIGMTGVDGTAIGSGLATALNRLKDSKARSRVVILLTDGRNNAGEVDPITAAKMAQKLGIRVYVIGCGAVGAGYITVNTFLGPRRVPTEEIDEDTLRKIAATSGGEYFRAQDSEGLMKIFRQIDRMEKTEIKVEKITRTREVFHWFLWPGLLLFIAELFLVKTILRRVP